VLGVCFYRAVTHDLPYCRLKNRLSHPAMGVVLSCDEWRETSAPADQQLVSSSRAPLAISMLAHEKNIRNRLHRRVIKMYGTHNVRDIGGYKTGRGKSIKWGEIYRGDRLSALAWEEQETLPPCNTLRMLSEPPPRRVSCGRLTSLNLESKRLSIYGPSRRDNPIGEGGRVPSRAARFPQLLT